MRWTCPECDRQFGRRGQGHTCAPGLTMAEYLATAPPHEPPVLEAVLAHVARLPEALVEPVQIGVFVKRRTTFARLVTRTRWVAMSLRLPRLVTSPAPDRKVELTGAAHHHTWNLRSAGDVTPALLDLLTEAYEADG